MEEDYQLEYNTINKLLNKSIRKEFGEGITVRLSSLLHLSNRDGRKRLTEKVYLTSDDLLSHQTLNLIEMNLIRNLNRLYMMISIRLNVVVKRVVLVVR